MLYSIRKLCWEHRSEFTSVTYRDRDNGTSIDAAGWVGCLDHSRWEPWLGTVSEALLHRHVYGG